MSFSSVNYIQENHPYDNIFQNVVGAPKVKLVKKLIPNLKIFGREMESPFLVHFEQV